MTVPAGLTIRLAAPADLEAIVDLALALGRQHESYDPVRFRLATFGANPAALRDVYRRFFVAALADAQSVLLVAGEADAVLGYAFARLEPPSFLDLAGASGWLHDLFVDERGRRRGVGDALVEASVRALRDLGAAQIMLAVAPKNERARALFDRFGFVPTMVEHRLAGPPDGSVRPPRRT